MGRCNEVIAVLDATAEGVAREQIRTRIAQPSELPELGRPSDMRPSSTRGCLVGCRLRLGA